MLDKFNKVYLECIGITSKNKRNRHIIKEQWDRIECIVIKLPKYESNGDGTYTFYDDVNNKTYDNVSAEEFADFEELIRSLEKYCIVVDTKQFHMADDRPDYVFRLDTYLLADTEEEKEEYEKQLLFLMNYSLPIKITVIDYITEGDFTLLTEENIDDFCSSHDSEYDCSVLGVEPIEM